MQTGGTQITVAEGKKMIIRRLEEKDARAVSELIITTIRISNVGDYPADLMEELVKTQTAEHVLERASGHTSTLRKKTA